jgi:chromosome segregation ATPase
MDLSEQEPLAQVKAELQSLDAEIASLNSEILVSQRRRDELFWKRNHAMARFSELEEKTEDRHYAGRKI